jgi:hypothetical protein
MVRGSNNEKPQGKEVEKHFQQNITLFMMSMSASLLLLYRLSIEQHSSRATF